MENYKNKKWGILKKNKEIKIQNWKYEKLLKELNLKNCENLKN